MKFKRLGPVSTSEGASHAGQLLAPAYERLKWNWQGRAPNAGEITSEIIAMVETCRHGTETYAVRACGTGGLRVVMVRGVPNLDVERKLLLAIHGPKPDPSGPAGNAENGAAKPLKGHTRE